MSGEKKMADDAVKGLEKAASAVLGLMALSEERARKLFDELVEKGTHVRAEGKTTIARILAEAEKERDAILKKAREEFSSALGRLNLATKDDIARLEKLINEKLK